MSTLIIFIICQALAGCGAIVTMYFDVKNLKTRLETSEKENKELRHELREMRDTLLLVKHSTDLLVLGKLKTGHQREP